MQQLTRRGVLRMLAAAGVGTATGAAAHGFLYERHRLHTVEETLRVAGWPPGLAGLRLGFLTDLHRSATVSHEQIAHAVREVMARAPDLIVLGGDYVTKRRSRFVT